MNMKDRVKRLEAEAALPPARRAQVERDAQVFSEQLARLVDNVRSEDASIPLAQRVATMSVAEHVAWSIAFVPDFVPSAAVIDQMMAMQADARRAHVL